MLLNTEPQAASMISNKCHTNKNQPVTDATLLSRCQLHSSLEWSVVCHLGFYSRGNRNNDEGRTMPTVVLWLRRRAISCLHTWVPTSPRVTQSLCDWLEVQTAEPWSTAKGTNMTWGMNLSGISFQPAVGAFQMSMSWRQAERGSPAENLQWPVEGWKQTGIQPLSHFENLCRNTVFVISFFPPIEQ